MREEEHLLNFVVNSLGDDLPIDFGENVEVTADEFDLEAVEAVGNALLQRDVLETLPDRPVEIVADLHFDPYYGDEDSVSHLCEISEESPHSNTVLHHLRTKFELAELERVGKTLIQ